MSVVTNNFLRFKPLLLDEDSDDDDMRSTVSSLFSSPSDIDMSSGTSYTTDSNRSDSPAPSVLSMTSSMEAATFKIEYGRAINSTSDVYGLPADDEELDRLGGSLSRFRKRNLMPVMGKCPRVVREYLTPAFPGDLRNVLDLGCGSGTW
ncbi:hypothetical protein PC9H_009009 [Pleurotus ostreatus]|uniref:Uncharacterized protein n=1 Tax=Pleurotus ostreatus TaxID=5322 RepID=A0A8H6ZWX6_PLEOS|nr:uncharacterized protein PC9H_009009 [Pleurotus ostreatus]KAF7426640.1 hypothetical protein PC9H_009009 [Pleurotus ostreatus]